MLRIMNPNDTSLSLLDSDEPMLAFQGEAGTARGAWQLFHDPKKFQQVEKHGFIVKETRLEGQHVYVLVTAHHNGGAEFWLNEPKLLVRGEKGFEPLPITSMNSAEAKDEIAVTAAEFKQVALGMLVKAGLVSAEEAAKGGYVAEGSRQRPSTPSTPRRQR